MLNGPVRTCHSVSRTLVGRIHEQTCKNVATHTLVCVCVCVTCVCVFLESFAGMFAYEMHMAHDICLLTPVLMAPQVKGKRVAMGFLIMLAGLGLWVRPGQQLPATQLLS